MLDVVVKKYSIVVVSQEYKHAFLQKERKFMQKRRNLIMSTEN